MNVTDINGNDDILWVNVTLVAPNGSYIFNNTNASRYSGSALWNVSYNLTSYGTWTWNFTLLDTDGFVLNSTNIQVVLMQITETLNATNVQAAAPIGIFGHVNLSNGSNATNTVVRFFVNEVEQKIVKNFTLLQSVSVTSADIGTT